MWWRGPQAVDSQTAEASGARAAAELVCGEGLAEPAVGPYYTVIGDNLTSLSCNIIALTSGGCGDPTCTAFWMTRWCGSRAAEAG